MEGELSSSRLALNPRSITPRRMIPPSTGALCCSSVASSSNNISSIVAHGGAPNRVPLTLRSSNAGILFPNLISYSGMLQQPLENNYPGLPTEAIRCVDALGAAQNNNGSANVQIEQILGSIGGSNEFDDKDEWLEYFENGDFDDIIANAIPADAPQMVGAAYSSLNFPICQPTTHQLLPSNSGQPCPTISPSACSSLNIPTCQPTAHQSLPSIAGQPCPTISPSATNVNSSKTRRRWTMELHDRFLDAVNQLGGYDKAKPKAIIDLMKVEDLTIAQVKSHLQKYRQAQCRRHSSEGTSEERTTSKEVITSDVQTDVNFAQESTLRMQMELQKKLHELLENQRKMQLKMEEQLIYIQQFENRQRLGMDSMLPPLINQQAAAPASSPLAPPEDCSARKNSDENSDAAALEAQNPAPTSETQRMPESVSRGGALN